MLSRPTSPLLRRLIAHSAAAVILGTTLGLLWPRSGAAEPKAGPRMVRVERPIVRTTPEAPEPVLIRTAMPTAWKSPERRCQRRNRRRFCDGPRQVPEPHGRASDMALALELGERDAAVHLLLHAPKAEWVDAVEGETKHTLIWPVDKARFVRGFGRTRKPPHHRSLHKGVDLSAPEGTPVRAVNDGIVAYSDNELSGYGNVILIVHADGSHTLYAHLRAAYMFPGQQVRRGQIIGEVGSTGLSHGPHLHFEWRVRGRPRNPMPRFKRMEDTVHAEVVQPVDSFAASQDLRVPERWL